tara:strand:+ start:49 stop:249 length:201 start_codon:yes stop_codon:yes gene_type:complete
MVQSLVTYSIETFQDEEVTVYSLWARFSNDTVAHCGYHEDEWSAQWAKEMMEKFEAKAIQAIKDNI